MSPSAPNPTENHGGFGARQGGATPLGVSGEGGATPLGVSGEKKAVGRSLFNSNNRVLPGRQNP